MNTLKISILVLVSFSFLFGYSQVQNEEPCAFDEIISSKCLADPNYEEYFNSFHNYISEKTKNPSSGNGKLKSTPIDGIYYIPIVFHVIHEGEETPSNVPYNYIQHQLQVLNEAYSGYVPEENAFNGVDTHIRFCLALETGNPFFRMD